MTGRFRNLIYSSENQLTGIEDYENNILTKQVSYKYDALGRRVAKEITDLQNSLNSYQRKYVYDGNEMLAEYDENNDILQVFTHSSLRTDDVLSTDVRSSKIATPGSYFYLKDALGSIVDITNSSGNLIQHYSYSSFGKLLKITDSVGTDITTTPLINQPFTFTNREYDSESKMMYYRARYYDSSIGRFLQTDPHPGKRVNPLTVINKYIYVGNNPTNMIDPNGEFGFLAAVAWAALYSAGVSAIQAGIQTNWGKDGDFWKAFQGDFAVNFGFSLLGISFASLKGAKDTFDIGWGGVFSNANLGSKYGFSLGFFQSVPGSSLGSAFYWHEVGHSINFALGGFFNDPEKGNYWGTLGYFALTLPGTGPLEHKYNPFSWSGEGSASAWGRLFSGKWYGLPQ